MPICQLAPDVAAKIAAGEVVERPASVVKELIENSIDAGATQIRVDLMNGGLQLIRVTDTGCGIPADELALALARHATSKVAQIDDLERIRTLGFRGEALASIAAVAEVTLLSRPRIAAQGAQISTANGQLSQVTTAAAPEGTMVTVRNLFSAVPARLKFLKGHNTEVSHCHHLLEQYALAYPEIRFSVFSEGRQILATTGDGQLSGVLLEIYGLQIAQQMMPVSGAERSADAEYPSVSGYVSRPTCYKNTRQHISFFVNRRWVHSRVLTTAVEEAYHSLLLAGRHPIAVMNIQLDPALLDVNVHPAKTEIRFLKERRVFAAIVRAIRHTLLQQPEMPQWQSARSSKQHTHAHLTTSVPAEEQESTQAEFVASVDSEEVSPLLADNPWLTALEEESGSKPPVLSRLWQSHIPRSDARRSVETPSARASLGRVETPPVDSQQLTDTPVESSSANSQPIETQSTPAQQVAAPLVAKRHKADKTVQVDDLSVGSQTITLQTSQDKQQRRLPRLRVVGQLAQSYIVTEGEDGMYLIDQHAAHERILLERMVAALRTRQAFSQLLLTPIALELAPKELEALEEHRQQLEHIGFTLEEVDHHTLLIKAVPSVLAKQVNVRSVHELLLDLTSPENLGHTETWEERALANVACKAAIKANYFLTTSEMREMLEQLEQTQAPFSCCHGRPTMIHFSLSALAHEFERR
jgi:DNA mismatch repair protein MutL